MDPGASRFADPLKDYGFNPLSRASLERPAEEEDARDTLEVLNRLCGGLNFLPSDPFEGRSTPASCTSRRRLDWLHDFSARSEEEANAYDEFYPEELLGGLSLPERLEFYLHGHRDLDHSDDQINSWELPESHPLKPSLRCPKHKEFLVNSNWYERLQWAYRRALPKGNIRRSLQVLGSEEEHELLLEIARFRKACTHGGTRLLVSLLHSGIDSHPTGFLDTSDPRLPCAEAFYAKKFQYDRQFVQDGIVYTLIKGAFGDTDVSYTVAKKIYANDQKAKGALCNALYKRGAKGPFAFPTQCVVDYLGFRLVAEPLVPLSSSMPQSLADELKRDADQPGGSTLVAITYALFRAPEISNVLKELSEYIHLSSWAIPFGASDVADILHHGAEADAQRCDGLLHIRNVHEVLPLILESGASSDPLYSVRFRPEFCYSYKQPLKSTLRSEAIFTEKSDEVMHNNGFNHLIIVLEENLDAFNGLLDSWDVTHAFHYHGVNIRYLGMAYEKTVYAGLKNLLATEMVARAVKHLWDRKIQDFLGGKLDSSDAVMRSFLHMVNDVFGLYGNSSDFWSQSIIPEIARHFNLVKLEGISYRILPHMMLKSAIEYNLGILLPPPSEGNTYRSIITAKDFKKVQMHPLLGKNIEHSRSSREAPHYRDYRPVLRAAFAKTKVVYPSREISIYKVGNKLMQAASGGPDRDLSLVTNPIELGICRHIRSKLIGSGYPCDPACVYNRKLTCVNYQQGLTGLNLVCLYECLLHTDVIKSMKLLIMMGYEYMRHRKPEEALVCAQGVILRGPPFWSKLMEARILELQAYCMLGNTDKCKELYEKLKQDVGKLECRGGLLSLQLYVIICIEAWMRREYSECARYSELANDCTVTIAGMAQYEWLPVSMASILGQCYEKLGKNVEAIKTQREAVRLCNVSQLPRFTLCHLTWLFVEYLLRNDFYTQGCSLSMELIPILEQEFGSLSLECLRCLYMSAWANHQVGCAHFIHPMAFLSNADRIIKSECGVDRIKASVLLEELVNASSCYVRRRHSNNALDLYLSLYERLVTIESQNRREISSYIASSYPDEENFYPLNKKDVGKLIGKIASQDELLLDMLEECELTRGHLLLVIKNMLSLKVLSLSSQHCMLVAYSLYNAYVSLVSRSCAFRAGIWGDDGMCLVGSDEHKPVSMYGSTIERQPEKFQISVSMEEKQVPHRGHELRSIEELLLRQPGSSEASICERCLSACPEASDVSDWFEAMLGLTPSASSAAENTFLFTVEILRHFLSPSKRLIILSHVANISNQQIDSTVTFKELRKQLVAAMAQP